MSNIYESDIADDVYDYLMDNTTIASFVDEFPSSWVDCANACIYLAIEQDKPLFKIKIERV